MTIILLLAIIAIAVLWFINRKKLQSVIKDLTARLAKSEEYKSRQSDRITELERKNASLSKYEVIVDAHAKAEEVILEAKKISKLIIVDAKKELDQAAAAANEIRSQAQKELDQAAISARSIKVQAKTDAANFKQNAIDVLSKATIEAKIIIEKADVKAQEIAGDAYKAMQNTAELENTAKAMKNIIIGYGTQYLVPTFSLLDDLADEFSHTQAGQKLAVARERTKLLVKDGKASKCEYVDDERRTTARNFVLDAFNGKVDSILSKVKKDNYGTLAQKIKDAYQLVNNNGKAFRNAAITDEYLNARLDELKWAVITQELKAEEQEEQRRIKEQIREEEKANKEFEKAMREAQKEEEALKKLIEKAQKEVAFASEEQKNRYEEKLKELEGKLQVAEEKNQRAISMAQQTKKGNVYIISNIGSFGDDVYKIGMTRRLEPEDRVKELGDASVPFEFDVHAMIPSENAPALEKELHKKFMLMQVNKVNPRKEFFKVSLADIKAVVEKMNYSAKWTLTAEARQYRESKAIELDISNDSQKKLDWEKHQMQVEASTSGIPEEMEA
jgi:hypothetical protein